MQDDDVFAFKSPELSQKRGLGEFAASVQDLTDVEYVANTFPLMTGFAVCQVPQNAARIEQATGQGMLNLVDIAFLFAWESWRKRNMIDE